ncbi:hypothetical protein KSP40_PGU013653 [Platanthera guangdongensis]|uniref:Pentatricopeptide repeat-containing protein n=1 Tax=Platanthera guangdongensis TaxID=2320717 RepID=A0ABR2M3M3_9ASPA
MSPRVESSPICRGRQTITAYESSGISDLGSIMQPSPNTLVVPIESPPELPDLDVDSPDESEKTRPPLLLPPLGRRPPPSLPLYLRPSLLLPPHQESTPSPTQFLWDKSLGFSVTRVDTYEIFVFMIPNDGIALEKFTWRAPTTEQQIYKIWKSYFSRIMTSEMRRIRRVTKSKSAPPPTWMRKEIFEELWNIWVADKYKDLQANNRRNRMSDRDGLGVVKSTAGSISIQHHAFRMIADHSNLLHCNCAIQSQSQNHKLPLQSVSAPTTLLAESSLRIRTALQSGKWSKEMEMKLQNLVIVLNNYVVNQVLKSLLDSELGFHFYLWAESQRGFKHDHSTIKSMICLLLKCQRFDLLSVILRKLHDDGFTPHRSIYRILISGYVKCGLLSFAFETFDEMIAHANAGLPVPHEKVFNRTHRTNKGRGPFVDKKSKKTFESYTLKLNEKQAQSNDTMTFASTNASSTYYPDLWIEASGGLKNGTPCLLSMAVRSGEYQAFTAIDG